MINFFPSNTIAPDKGHLLISEPFLSDPYFKRTVILLCEHSNEDGTFGFVLNKYLDVKLSELVPDFPEITTRIATGGPVEQNSLYFIHTRPDLMLDSKVISENLCVGGDFESLKNYFLNGLIDESEVRFFVGYSGWSAGQLDQEMKEKAWIVAQATVERVMNCHEDHLWESTLKTLGKDFAILANFPEDPNLN